MSNTDLTPAQSLARADYELLTRLASTAAAVTTGQKRVAEAHLRDVAYHAAELTQKAQEAATAMELVQLTGAQARYPEIAQLALAGDSTGVSMALMDAMKEVMGY